jgi:hypothetical protein
MERGVKCLIFSYHKRGTCTGQCEEILLKHKNNISFDLCMFSILVTEAGNNKWI